MVVMSFMLTQVAKEAYTTVFIPFFQHTTTAYVTLYESNGVHQ